MARARTPAGKLERREGVDLELKGERRAAGRGALERRPYRQFISHGHVIVDGRRVDIPSYEVSPGQTTGLRPGAPVWAAVRDATELVAAISPWLEADHDQISGRILREPEAGEVQAPVETQPIVEHYSR